MKRLRVDVAVLRIRNGKVVTPSGIVTKGTVVIDRETILDIDSSFSAESLSDDMDVEGAWIVPGIIDTHSDSIEKEIQPRKKIHFPIQQSLLELDKKFAISGITTVYHAIAMLEQDGEDWIRNNSTALQIIDCIKGLPMVSTLIDHRVHLRLEITNTVAVPIVEKLIGMEKIDQLSVTDHTPGQGQYSDIEARIRLFMRKKNVSINDARKLIEQEMNKEKIGHAVLAVLAELACTHKIAVASHDDDTLEKIEAMKELNATISEFPINLETAKAAKEKGMHIVMGAPNLLLGRSRINNLSALEAIQNGLVDILCSDYYPPALLRSIFYLYSNGWSINKAVNLVTYNPACAMGISDTTGSIDIGKCADLLVLKEGLNGFFVKAVIVKGKVVCNLTY